jgi:hypothetical protein
MAHLDGSALAKPKEKSMNENVVKTLRVITSFLAGAVLLVGIIVAAQSYRPEARVNTAIESIGGRGEATTNR